MRVTPRIGAWYTSRHCYLLVLLRRTFCRSSKRLEHDTRLQSRLLVRQQWLHHHFLALVLLSVLLCLVAAPYTVLGATLADTCTATCSHFERCVVYDGAAFCAQQCAPGRCDDATEACVLQGTECAQAPCLPIAVCEPKSMDGAAAATAEATAISNTAYNYAACARTCPMIDAPVCASDNVTYANACIFDEAQCRTPSLTLISKGLCAADLAFAAAFHASSSTAMTATTTSTAIATAACDAIVCADVADPVCSSSGTLLNACEFKRTQCRDSTVTLLSRGACSQSTQLPLPRCPTSCTHEFAPMCASTGTLYANECFFRQAKCARPFAVGFFARRDLTACEHDTGDSTRSDDDRLDMRAAVVAALD